jgi:hypothetical protein
MRMQAGTAVTLPGGVFIDGRLAREAEFRPLTGRVEERLAALASGAPRASPRAVSALLATALAVVGEWPATEALAASLGVPDRQFLMFAIALQLGPDEQWRHLICARCNARFDVGFRWSALPLTPAGENYPWTEAVVGQMHLRLRVPNGDDEELIAGVAASAARRALALRCVVAIDQRAPTEEQLEALDDTVVDAIDAALDAIAPQVATTLSTACNECGAPHLLVLDPYRFPVPDAAQLYREVHALASRYHWSEPQILRLPRERRRMYLDMIDHSAGAASH